MTSVLTAAERRAASLLLAEAWGSPAEITAAEAIWDRRHVVRLHLGAGRSAVLKRRSGRNRDGFGIELAALAYLNGMPAPAAPRLLGADPDAGILLMEDLGPGASLADSLLAGDGQRARADLIAYARALGSLHAWSRGRPAELADLRDRYAPGAALAPGWLGAVGRGQEGFVGLLATLGLAADGIAEEIDELVLILNGPGYLGLVHGDACPDNVRLLDGGCQIFDFEVSGWGAVALDAAYLLAPFPSCWCFADLPAEAAAPALDAYVQAAGIEAGPQWDAATAAALAAWIVARGHLMARVLEEDREWGTTTLRPRLLTWLRSFTEAAGRAGVLPRLRALAAALRDELSARWPGTAVPGYPALARPGSAPVEVPDWWRPGV